MKKVPIEIQIKAVKRELAFRRFVYPSKVKKGTMTDKEAEHELETMAAVLNTLEWLRDKYRKPAQQTELNLNTGSAPKNEGIPD